MKKMKDMTQQHGVTLIELMVVMAIIGILAAIAYPNYHAYVIKSRRNDAQGALVSFANAMERYYTENYTYTGAASGGGDTGAPPSSLFPSQAPLDGSSKFYNLTIQKATDDCDGDSTADDPCFTVRATPISTTDQADDGKLELDSSGARRWDKDNDGTLEDGWS
jgi:type IV pilus assembly protein PilE